MEHLTILVDMDDTIECLSEAWVDYLNTRYGTTVKHEDITEWNVSKFFPELSKEQVYDVLLEDEFWNFVRPMEGASEYLQRLINDGHKVFIVTSSHYKTMKAKMENVLFKYFPFLSWDDVIVTSHKNLIKGDVIVDDGPHNLEDGQRYKLLFDAPHNRTYDAGCNGMTRVRNWEEAYAAITIIALL